MNVGSAEFAAFLSFLGLQGGSPRILDQIARIHGLILVSMHDRNGSSLEHHLDDEEQFHSAYRRIQDTQTVLEFFRSTTGEHCQLTVDSSQHVTLIHPNRVFDL